jgi:hypothetical protein
LPKWRPPYAYVPGINPRHDEALFDEVKADLAQAWPLGCDLLRDRFFWEAHEVLEAVWMGCAPNGAERVLVQGVIQLANAGLKQRMGKTGAVVRLLALADRLSDEAFQRGGAVVMGLDVAAVAELKRQVVLKCEI